MTKLTWWQEAVFYQIYPRSFADGNGDGIGDLYGVIQRLDYLQDLGIDAIWMSPQYPSPQFDCGYDIADYTGINPEYGTMDTFREFLEGAHQRDIRVVLDLVLNHTSHLHTWFQESKSGRDNPKRDWYIWRDGRNGKPPNNWYSTFGGSAWEYDPATDQYYYHFFLKEQPDLNWRNPEVKEAMFDSIRFWLDMGVDGFRLDAIDTIFEDLDLPDQNCEFTQEDLHRLSSDTKWDAANKKLAQHWDDIYQYQLRQPGIHELFREIRTIIDSYDDRVLVGETDDVTYYGNGEDELHLAFNFSLMRTNHLTPAWVRANHEERLSLLPENAWPCNTLGNHDSPRVYTHYGDGQHDDPLARISLALMLTLRGTPFLYNGEEIGMADYYLDAVAKFKDLWGIWHYNMRVNVLGLSPEEALNRSSRATRDKCRTPMQWDNAPNGGFSPAGVTPWLPVNPNYAQGINVAEQDNDPGSLLNFYRQMLRVRRETPALIAGDYQAIHENAGDYLAFLRQTPEQTVLVVLNMSQTAQEIHFDDMPATTAQRIFSSHSRAGQQDDLTNLTLAPFEIYIAEV